MHVPPSPTHTLLAVAHAIAAMVLVGASTHLAVTAARWRQRPRPQALRLHAATVMVAWLATIAIGLIAYPEWRVGVRPRLDVAAPWVVALFELKEDVAALGLPLALGVWLLGRRLEPDDRVAARALAAFAGVGAAMAWFSVGVGLAVSLWRVP